MITKADVAVALQYKFDSKDRQKYVKVHDCAFLLCRYGYERHAARSSTSRDDGTKRNAGTTRNAASAVSDEGSYCSVTTIDFR